MVILILAKSKRKKKPNKEKEAKTKPKHQDKQKKKFEPDQIPMAATSQTRKAPVQNNAYSNSITPAAAPIASRPGMTKSSSASNMQINERAQGIPRNSPPHAIQEQNTSYPASNNGGRFDLISPSAIQMTSSRDEPLRRNVVPQAGGYSGVGESRGGVQPNYNGGGSSRHAGLQPTYTGSGNSYGSSGQITSRENYARPAQPSNAGSSVQPTQTYRGVTNQVNPAYNPPNHNLPSTARPSGQPAAGARGRNGPNVVNNSNWNAKNVPNKRNHDHFDNYLWD